MLSYIFQTVIDHSVALYHSVVSNKRFDAAIEFYQHITDLDHISDNDLFPLTGKQSILNENNATIISLINGDFRHCIQDDDSHYIIMNAANPLVPGGAAHRAKGTYDELLHRITNLYDKLKQHYQNDTYQSAAQKQAINHFYRTIDAACKQITDAKSNGATLSFFEKAQLIFRLVLAERTLMHSKAAEILPGNIEVIDNVYLNTGSIRINASIINGVAPDLRISTGEPGKYCSLLGFGTVNEQYKEKIYNLFRRTINKALSIDKDKKHLILNLAGCGVFGGDSRVVLKILTDVIKELSPSIEKQNLKISLPLVGFNKYCGKCHYEIAVTAFHETSLKLKPQNPHESNDTECNMTDQPMLMYYQHNKQNPTNRASVNSAVKKTSKRRTADELAAIEAKRYLQNKYHGFHA